MILHLMKINWVFSCETNKAVIAAPFILIHMTHFQIFPPPVSQKVLEGLKKTIMDPSCCGLVVLVECLL